MKARVFCRKWHRCGVLSLAVHWGTSKRTDSVKYSLRIPNNRRRTGEGVWSGSAGHRLNTPLANLGPSIAIACWLAAGVGMVLLTWALFWDSLTRRKEHQHRCPRCWYAMTGVPGLRCPECGFVARDPRALRRVRRHWWCALVGTTLVAISITGLYAPLVPVKAFAAWTPSWVLVRLVTDPCIDPPTQFTGTADKTADYSVQHFLVEELWNRDAAGLLSLDQQRALASRQFTAARPPVTIATRARWPAGYPVWASAESWIGGMRSRSAKAEGTWNGNLVALTTDPGGGGSVRDTGRPGWILTRWPLPGLGSPWPNFDPTASWSSPTVINLGCRRATQRRSRFGFQSPTTRAGQRSGRG